MVDTGVRERPGQVGVEARPVFDVAVGKLRIPSTRPGSVRRAQGKSIYRKLGAASRSQAVARARELGLLEG